MAAWDAPRLLIEVAQNALATTGDWASSKSGPRVGHAVRVHVPAQGHHAGPATAQQRQAGPGRALLAQDTQTEQVAAQRRGRWHGQGD